MGYYKSVSSEEVWSYTTRTLTQTQFPFWTSVITQQQTNLVMPANGYGIITIQPQGGETWLLYITTFQEYYGSSFGMRYYDYDGTTARLHHGIQVLGTYGWCRPAMTISKILTDSLYAYIKGYNGSSTTNYHMYVGYSGFKLGTKKVVIDDFTNTKRKVLYRKTAYKINSELSGLGDLICDIYNEDDDEYEQVIFLEKDKILHSEGKHAVCKGSIYVRTVDLISNIQKIKNGEIDINKSGYAKYLKKWKIERNIDFGIEGI